MKSLTLDERACQIRGKIASGIRIPAPELLVNTGRRRSQEKRDLLAALKRRAEEGGKRHVFKANS